MILTVTCETHRHTRFLIGPRRQCGKMFHKKRRIACILYLVLLFAVIILAFIVSPIIQPPPRAHVLF